MVAEEILRLFEENWFYSKCKNPSSSMTQRPNPDVEGIQESEDREKFREADQEEDEALPPPNVLVTRSVSEQSLVSSKTSLLFGSLDDGFSPKSVLNEKAPSGKLRTILSGKEVNEFSPDEMNPKKERESRDRERKKKKQREVVRKRRKSLSDLAYDELKGFMDLGFVFSEEDHMDSNLVSILPGLQRSGRQNRDEESREEEGAGNINMNKVARPYFSEAWELWGERKEKKSMAVMKWNLPAPENEVDMKDQLKLWAHTVASTVR